MNTVSAKTVLVLIFFISLLDISTSATSVSQKGASSNISTFYTATERSYGNQKIGVVSYKGRSVMRLVQIPKTKESVLLRVQKIATVLNTNVPNREATLKISLTTSANIYHIACNKKPLFDFYPEDTVFNGVNNAKLLRSWIVNLNRIMDSP